MQCSVGRGHSGVLSPPAAGVHVWWREEGGGASLSTTWSSDTFVQSMYVFIAF